MGDIDINDLGIDLDGIEDPRSFLEGLLWFVRALRKVNENVKQDMHQFDGDEMAEGVRMMLDKQEEVFTMIEALAIAVLNK
jgi:hypothetical protein